MSLHPLCHHLVWNIISGLLDYCNSPPIQSSFPRLQIWPCHFLVKSSNGFSVPSEWSRNVLLWLTRIPFPSSFWSPPHSLLMLFYKLECGWPVPHPPLRLNEASLLPRSLLQPPAWMWQICIPVYPHHTVLHYLLVWGADMFYCWILNPGIQRMA